VVNVRTSMKTVALAVKAVRSCSMVRALITVQINTISWKIATPAPAVIATVCAVQDLHLTNAHNVIQAVSTSMANA